LLYVFEVGESEKYELTSLLFDDLCPTTVLTSTRCSVKFVDFLNFNCKYYELDESGMHQSNKKKTTNPKMEEAKTRKRKFKNSSENDEEIGENCSESANDENSDPLSIYSKELCKAFEKRQKEIPLIQMAANDFSYELGKERIMKISSLEDMPENLRSDTEKFLYFSSFLDFDDTLMIRCIAGLLRYLDRHHSIDIEFNQEEPDASNGNRPLQTPIYSFRPLTLDKILLLDSNAFESLNIIHRIDLECPNRQTPLSMDNFRTILNEKRQTSTLYSFFMKKLCTKYGMHKLRSWFLKPSRDLTVLKQRHSMIEFFIASENYELVNLLRSILKKCKYIRPIFNRMRVGSSCTFTHWKRLHSTTRAILKVCQICRVIAQKSGVEKTPTAASSSEIDISFSESLLYDKRSVNRPKGSMIFESIFESKSTNALTPLIDKNNSTTNAQKPKSWSNLAQNTKASSDATSDSRFTNSAMRLNAALKLADAYSDKTSLLTRINNSKYAVKFDFLASLFERTISITSSREKNKCTVNDNVSALLDEKRRIYAKLPEYLTEIAASEFNKYDLIECNVMYMPHLGFLLVIGEADLDRIDEPSIEQRQARFEHIHELKFIFKSNKQYYYKNTKMKELDAHFGDISSDINDLESNVIKMLQVEFLNYSHYYADMIDYCGELDVLLAFASVAKENDYVKPKFNLTPIDHCMLDSFERDSFVCASKVRHPLLETNIESIFVPNDVHSGCRHENDVCHAKNIVPKIKVITAPNASGK
jgi:DNA mismatch repair ATPase MutS